MAEIYDLLSCSKQLFNIDSDLMDTFEKEEGLYDSLTVPQSKDNGMISSGHILDAENKMSRTSSSCGCFSSA